MKGKTFHAARDSVYSLLELPDCSGELNVESVQRTYEVYDLLVFKKSFQQTETTSILYLKLSTYAYYIYKNI